MRKLIAAVVAALILVGVGGVAVTNDRSTDTTEDARIWPWRVVADAFDSVFGADKADAAVVYSFFCWKADNPDYYILRQSTNPQSARAGCFQELGAKYWDWEFYGTIIDCPGTGMDLGVYQQSTTYWYGQIRRVYSDNPFCSNNTTWYPAKGIFWQV